MVTVEIEDKGGNCGSIGMGNGTWFTILDIPGVENGKALLIEFLRNCKGFRTH